MCASLLPTADIPHDSANVRELPVKTASLDRLSFTGPDGKKLTLDQALQATNTDGIVVLHRGSIVLERYFNGMIEHSPHIFMSVTKSMLGLLAGILVERRILDVSQPVRKIIPELA